MAEKVAKPAGGNWNTAGTWEPEGVPTASDDVFLKSTSGSVTLNAAAVCRSINLTGYTGTLTHNAFDLTLGTSTEPPSGKALVFPASGWTYTLTSVTNSRIVLGGSFTTSAQTVDLGGKTIGNLQIGGASATSFKLLSGYVQGATSSTTISRGTFDFNGQTCTIGIFSSVNSNVREVKFGAATLTILGNWECTTTSLTVAANTATATMSGAAVKFEGGSADWNGLTLKMTGSGAATLTLTGKLGAFTRTGTAVKTDTLVVTSSFTITGKGTFTGNSLTNRILVASPTAGTQVTITAKESAPENVDFMDIKGAGEAAWSGTSVGNALGNEGITFTTPVTRFAKAAGLWSATTTWSATSGGAAGASVPLCHDTVKMDGNAGTGTYTIDMPRACAELKMESFARTLNATVGHSIYGSAIYSAGATISAGASGRTYRGRGTHVVTSAGKSGTAMTFIAPGGTYTLEDDLNTSSNNLEVQMGTFNANGHNVTISSFQCNTAFTRTVKMGSGKWTLTANPTVWFTTTPTGLTLEPETATIELSDTTANAKAFRAGPGQVFAKMVIPAAGTGAISLSGAGPYTIKTLEVLGGPKTITLLAAETFIFETLVLTSGEGKLITINSSISGTAAHIKVLTGKLSFDFLSIKDSTAEGGAEFFAGTHSENVSNNTGWVFSAPGKLIELALEDSQGVTEERASSPRKPLADGQPLADARASTAAKPLADGQVSSDARVSALAKLLTASQSLSDSRFSAAGKASGDAQAISDSLAKQPKIAEADSILVSDAMLRAFGLTRTEIVGLAELLAISDALNLTLTDAVSTAEGAGKKVSTGRADHQAVVEGMARAVGLERPEAISFVEQVAKHFETARADAAVVTDSMLKFVGLERSDVEELADELARSWHAALRLEDTVTTADFLETALLAVNRAILILLSDAPKVQVQVSDVAAVTVVVVDAPALAVSVGDSV